MPDLAIENAYQEEIVAGVDEAGRGPLAGPVVAAAVIVDRNNLIKGVRDSKKLSVSARNKLYELITSNYTWAVGIVPSKKIDQINILEATKEACLECVANLPKVPTIVLVDGNMKFFDARFKSVVKGDNLSYSIAAASIVAKVTRDRLMMSLDEDFPEYKWRSNAGYGTKEHIEAIINHGLSVHHRKSFKVNFNKYKIKNFAE